MSEETCTRKEFAARLGFRPSYVSQLIKDGRVVLTNDGARVCVQASIDKIRATRDPSKMATVERHAAKRATETEAAPPPPPAPPDDPDSEGEYQFSDARGKREHYLALAAKRDYEISMGDLLRTADVRRVLLDAGNALRQRFEQLPTILAPAIVEAAPRGESAVRVVIDDALNHALGEFSRALAKLGGSDGTAG